MEVTDTGISEPPVTSPSIGDRKRRRALGLELSANSLRRGWARDKMSMEDVEEALALIAFAS